jgi:hypothetical protein
MVNPNAKAHDFKDNPEQVLSGKACPSSDIHCVALQLLPLQIVKIARNNQYSTY